eukprot:TRINITY_DN52054_c0_g1_i2.p1 TRINITY_DN52054_c0_g1~~TRINITY_DN52054_c0_g1_i2.p1  ORF type:complete len:381 (-),score=51.76 TRINITY_DN52054_c0_g1_i2:118-1260(-)
MLRQVVQWRPTSCVRPVATTTAGGARLSEASAYSRYGFRRAASTRHNRAAVICLGLTSAGLLLEWRRARGRQSRSQLQLSRSVALACQGAGAELLAERAVDLVYQEYYPAGRVAAGSVTVVFIHGLDSWRGTWKSAAEELAKRGVRSLAVDLRGHGESPMGAPEDLQPAQMAADVRKALIRAGVVRPDDASPARILLVGHSMGGRIAMRYAADYSDDLTAVVIEDMDARSREYPQAYMEPSAGELEMKKAFQRAQPSWEACRANLLRFGYDEPRVDKWPKEDPPRVLPSKDGGEGVWSAINPYAQWLARKTVLSQKDSYVALQKIAGIRLASRPDLGVHVMVAGEKGTVCSWDGLPGGIRDMEGMVPGLRHSQQRPSCVS